MSVSNLPILIVEDEPDEQELVSRMLAQVGVPVHVAGDAEIAWSYLMANPYMAAIIDLALPGKDGFELLTAIRQQPEVAQLPCVAITAFHAPELKQQAIHLGFDAYFAKPLDRTRYIGELDRLLAPA
jgi:CheY-like chemotaxis protein